MQSFKLPKIIVVGEFFFVGLPGTQESDIVTVTDLQSYCMIVLFQVIDALLGCTDKP
jgi:hypothetical protein